MAADLREEDGHRVIAVAVWPQGACRAVRPCHRTCQDTGPSAPAEQALSVQVARIDGVDPGTAVAVLPDGSVFIKSASLAVIKSVLKDARGIRWDYSS
jgi:hypothetical protein